MNKINIQLFAEPEGKAEQIGGNEKQIINNNLDEQVKSTNIKTTEELEPGICATTLSGGLEVPIMYKEILAGEYIESWKIDQITRLITPTVPTLDRLYMIVKAFFVPYTRVWKDAEKFIAGKASADLGTGTQLTIPTASFTMGGTSQGGNLINFAKRYSLAHRYGGQAISNLGQTSTVINLLPLRGYRAIYNDFIRNKEYETAYTEYNETTPTATEISQTNPSSYGSLAATYTLAPSQSMKCYLTNIKKNINTASGNGGTTDYMPTSNELKYNHLDWQSRFQNEKQRAINAIKNDWDIIAEMGGTQPVTADRVEFLGKLEYELNFQQLSQTTPPGQSGQTPLGTTGSFSYTRINGEIFSHKQFLQGGFIHVLATVQTPKRYEKSIPKELIKTNVNELYRPGLAKKEVQTLKVAEIINNGGNQNTAVAYQPAWAEYKRMPNICTGDMQSDQFTQPASSDRLASASQWHSFIPGTQPITTISNNYFNNYAEVNRIIARNNTYEFYDGANSTFPIFIQEPILQISEHRIKTKLPIEWNDLNSVDKAEKQR